MSRLLIIAFFSMIVVKSMAQESVSYSEIDSISYRQCLDNDFKGIQKTMKLAASEGIEFYYLYLRAGIVAYNFGSLEYALKQFRAAQSMNPADPELQSYLYLTLYLSNRVDDAREYGKTLSEELQKKLEISTKNQFTVAIGFLAAINNNISSNKSNNFLTPNKVGADVILNGSVFGNSYAFDMTHKFRTHIYNKVTFFKTNSMAIEQIAYANQNKSSSYSNSHLQYNFGISRTFKNELNVGLGFGFFHTNFSQLLVRFNTQGIATFKDTVSTYNNISFAASVGKRLGIFHPVFNLYYSNLYSENQFQMEGVLSYYPLSNRNLVATTAFSYIRNGSVNQTVFNQKVSYKCLPWLWVDGKFSVGNHMNYMSTLGFVSFNTADTVRNNVGLDFHFYYKKFEFIFGYSLQTREATYTTYPSLTTSESTSYKYKSNNLITTLKWNF